eukprot:CAMPEP_0178983848 /NCGR_PEP_ID=MMETSP0795-20121207/1287_1 /TAXON_ID=88552 /ORGANISM="Amoebophrya sp., Strain Ameob2" /LENGTH=102 /DNA_ID=CAMNT_0020674665 /DNA_START=150 /DNA_END=458 /DNA_ORIENTATION=-
MQAAALSRQQQQQLFHPIVLGGGVVPLVGAPVRVPGGAAAAVVPKMGPSIWGRGGGGPPGGFLDGITSEDGRNRKWKKWTQQEEHGIGGAVANATRPEKATA